MRGRLEISPSTRETHRSDFKSSPVYSSSDVTRSLQTVYSKTTHWVSESMTPCCCLETRTDWRHHVIAVHVMLMSVKLQARCMMGYKLRVSGVQWAVARSHKPTNKPPRSCQSDETAQSNGKWPFHRIIWLYTHSEFTGFLFEENIMILMTSTCLHDFAFWQKLLNPIY